MLYLGVMWSSIHQGQSSFITLFHFWCWLCMCVFSPEATFGLFLGDSFLFLCPHISASIRSNDSVLNHWVWKSYHPHVIWKATLAPGVPQGAIYIYITILCMGFLRGLYIYHHIMYGVPQGAIYISPYYVWGSSGGYIYITILCMGFLRGLYIYISPYYVC